jgi:Tol biopolymer transport system component
MHTRLHTRPRTLLSLAAWILAVAACQDRTPLLAPGFDQSSAQASTQRVDGGGIPFGIAFVSTRAGNPDVWVMGSDGTDLAGRSDAQNLTSDNPGSDVTPSWSNDGRIAFGSVRAPHANSEIYVMNSDGSDLVRVTQSTAANVQPAWSPNAKELAFVRGSQGSRQIWAIDLADGSERQLTHAGDNYHPAWSPNGKEIVFSSDRNGDFVNALPAEKAASLGLHDIYIMDADAGDAELTRVTNNPTSLDGEPSFSPNGKELVFRTRRETAIDPDGVLRHWCTIAIANTDGSDIRYLTPKPANVLSTQWCNAFPAWSRDGKTVYFHSARLGVPLDVYSIGADGTGLARLTWNTAVDQMPAVR